MAVCPQGPVEYVENLAVAADLGFNALLGGTAHGTFSARAWRAKCAGKRWGNVACWLLEHTFGPGHPEQANATEAVVLTALATAEQAAHPPA